jgi:PAS domain S-box-containing protein
MAIPLHVLIIEDSESDAELALHHLEKAGYSVTSQRVETAETMKAALDKQSWEIVISDYSLPSFSAPVALCVLQDSGQDIPFIVVSGTITEEIAIELMRSGASDYLMKDRLARLGPLVKRELNIIQVRQERNETRAALQKSQEWSNLIYNSTSNAMFLLAVESDNVFRCLTVNAAYLKITGLSEEQVVGKLANEVLTPQTAQYVLGKYQEAIRDGRAIHYEENAALPRGLITVETTLTPILNQEGRCTHLLGTSHEITDRIQAELLLRESEEKFRFISENSFDLISLLDTNGCFRYCNTSYAHILGYTPDELIGHSGFELVHPDEKEELFQLFQNSLADKQVAQQVSAQRILNRIRCQDGSYKLVEHRFGLLLDEQGNIVQILLNAQDISEHKRVEQSLRLSEEKFFTAFRVSPDSININRLKDGLYIEINEGFKALTGYTTEEVIGKTSLEINIWDNPQDRSRLVQGLREKGEVANLEAPFRIKNGTVKICLMSARIIEINGEQCILSVTRDITDRKIKEREYTTFIQTSFDGFWCIDTSGRFLDVNDALCQMLGYTREELCAMGISDIEVNENPEEIAAHIQKIIQAGSDRFQTRHRRKDGMAIDVEINAQYVALVKRCYVFIHDITEQKQAEAALRESEYFFKETQRVGFIGSFKTNFVTGFWESSEVLDQIFGIDRTYTRDILGWLDIVHPDDREMMDRYLREEVISRCKPFNMEYRIIRKSDGESRWIHGLGEVNFDIEGNIHSLIGTIQDITERKQVEDKLNDQLEELRRWHAVTLGREERIHELKKEVNRLLIEAGKPSRYASAQEAT